MNKKTINSFTVTVKEKELKELLGLSQEECDNYTLDGIESGEDGDILLFFCQ